MYDTIQRPAVEVIQRAAGACADRKPARIKRVAAYCRVSTDMEQQQSSLELQMSSFRAQIEARADWELAGVYADNGVTGTQAAHRTEFLRMMDDCDNGLIDYIITKSISRFARNTLECLSYVRRLKAKGVYVYFEKERLDTINDTSEMILSILAAVAQEESRNISENIKWNQRKRFAEGKAKWAAIYGYTKDGELEYIIDEGRASTVRRVFSYYLQGKSLPEICRTLAGDGNASPWGKSWTPTTLSKMLKNEKYCGDILMQKSYTMDHLTHKRIWNNQDVVPSYYVRDHHKPIIDRKTFEMAQIILSLKDLHKGSTEYPYYGRLICPICGGKMFRSCIKGAGHPMVWRCSQENGSDQCRRYYIEEKYIDQAFREAYASLDMDALEKQSRRRDETVAQPALAAIRLKNEMAKIDRVEYYQLDALVQSITFQKWDTLVFQWTFDLKSKVNIPFKRNRDIPNHPEQKESVGSRSPSRIENRQLGRCPHTSFKRHNVYGYDSIVSSSDG